MHKVSGFGSERVLELELTALSAGVDVYTRFYLSCAVFIPAGGSGEGAGKVAAAKLKIQHRPNSLLHPCLSPSAGLLWLVGTEGPLHWCPAAVCRLLKCLCADLIQQLGLFLCPKSIKFKRK